MQYYRLSRVSYEYPKEDAYGSFSKKQKEKTKKKGITFRFLCLLHFMEIFIYSNRWRLMKVVAIVQCVNCTGL